MTTSFNTRNPYNSKREIRDPFSLSFDEQNEILRSFPSNVKFSYEKSTHKKVLSDVYVIIPKGKKYFAWFTHRNRKNICKLLFFPRGKRRKKRRQYSTYFKLS